MKKNNEDIQGFWFGYIDAIIMIMSIFLILYIFSENENKGLKDQSGIIKENERKIDSLNKVNLEILTDNRDLANKEKSSIDMIKRLEDELAKKNKGKGRAMGTCFDKNKENEINGFVNVEYIFKAIIIEDGLFLVKDNVSNSSELYTKMNFDQIKSKYSEQIQLAKKNTCHLKTYFDYSKKIDKNALKRSESLLKTISIPHTGKETKLVYIVITGINKFNIKGEGIEYVGIDINKLNSLKDKFTNIMAELSCYTESLDAKTIHNIQREISGYFLYVYAGYGIDK